MLKYIEKRTGYSGNGPAWIGYVTVSKSGRTLYFNGQAFRKGSGVSGNYIQVGTSDEYWISTVKKNGADRHWAGSGKVLIERAALDEYLKRVTASTLDSEKYELTDDILPTDPDSYQKNENKKG